jgi:hypothetical protein
LEHKSLNCRKSNITPQSNSLATSRE